MDYAWRRLPAAEAGAVDRHLAHCAACHALLEEERALGRALAALPPATPTRDLWEAVRARQATPPPSLQPMARLMAPVLAAREQAARFRMQWGLAVSVGMAALLMMLTPGPDTRPPTGAMVLAHALDTAHQVAQQSDDPMAEISDNALDILSVAATDTGKEPPS